jgi:hypothetical protein
MACFRECPEVGSKRLLLRRLMTVGLYRLGYFVSLSVISAFLECCKLQIL